MVVFQGLNFADHMVQESMRSYVHDLVELDFISNNQPERFWLDDYQQFVKDHNLQSTTFQKQLDLFLQHGLNSKLYSNVIVRSEDGNLIASAVYLSLDIDLSDTKRQIEFLSAQDRVTQNQPVNKDAHDLNFFTFSPSYYMWEFFAVTTHEIILNIVLGLVVVFIATLIFAHRYSGCIFVTSTVAMIFLDVLGIIQAVGLFINPVTYISVVLSIGLMVDYVVHVMFKYFESEATTREEKVLDCLTTMGSSILLGGTSTVIATIPLAFSSSKIFLAVFIIFMSFVVLSLVHGLVFLPILLTIFGPQDMESIGHEENDDEVIEITRKRTGTGQTADLCLCDDDCVNDGDFIEEIDHSGVGES
jgi:predicted RND superfamily exporter protein